MYKVTIDSTQAPEVLHWLTERGGMEVWNSLYIGDGRQWFTPVQDAGKPHWAASRDEDIGTITDPAEIEVVDFEVFKRFHVGIRKGAQGLSYKLTDGATRKLRRYMARAGPGARYDWDYEAQDALVYRPTNSRSLADWQEEVTNV